MKNSVHKIFAASGRSKVNLLVLLFSLFFVSGIGSGYSAFAQANSRLNGKVTSASTGEPLPGVAVFVAGTAHSCYSDIDGSYSLSFKASDNTEITWQLMGFVTVKQIYKGEGVIDIKLEDDLSVIDEVVVTGYNSIRKEGFTGNTVKITKEELLRVSPKNVISSIQVFDPSFRIVENIEMGSDPNALPEFNLRGTTAMKMEVSTNTADISRQNLTSNNNLPIFILDGFEVGVEKIYDMDPQRIQSLTLLKDAAATALYGSRAANGVIVIETRKPEEGRLQVTYNFTASVEVPDLTTYNLMTAREKLDAEVAAGYYNLDPDPLSGDLTSLGAHRYYIAKLNNINRGVETDWLAKGVRTSLHHKHSLYINGGTEDIRWGAELKYDNTNGVMPSSSRNTYGAGLVLDYRVGKFQILNRTDFDNMKNGSDPTQAFSNYVHLQPYDVLTDYQTGRYLKELNTWGSGTRINPLYEAEYLNSFSKSNYSDFSNKLQINCFVNSDITAKVQFAVDKKFSETRTFLDPSSATFSKISDPRYLGSLSTIEDDTFSYDLNALLLYNKNIGKNYISTTAGAELIENSVASLATSYTGFPNGSLYSVNNAMMINGKPVRTSNKTRLASFLLMANYSWADIYLCDISLRLDGSSEFGKEQKMAPFWSAGAGINVHKYEFLQDNKVLSTLKLRTTYGQVGKVNFPIYAATSSYSSTSTQDWYLTGMGNMMYYLGNNELSWEKTNSFDAGFDLGLFEDKVMTRFSYYVKNTTDLITTVTLPSSSGFTSYMDNLGKIQNKGCELDVRINAVNTKDWGLMVFGNLSHNKNRIMEISDALKAYNEQVDKLYADYREGSTSQQDSKYSTPHTKFIEGGSTTSIFGMKSLGINPANGKELYLTPEGKVTYQWSAADQVIIGDTEPKIRGSFGFNARWKQLSLFTSFLYRAGGQQYNQTLVSYVEDVNLLATNADRRVNSMRWKNPGDVTQFKGISENGYTTRPTSRFVQRDNLLQFNSVSLSYDVRPEIIHKAGISMARIMASMQDLGYWSTIHRERGLAYPFSRTFNFSVNLSF
ncbi:MAG: SusC/RagA family TonB-linked outer membrane protein [Bacteroidales bacterium]|nr:SusC/RagA family TonB-linked outer membrane protein [Bacteroidales bacterium]